MKKSIIAGIVFLSLLSACSNEADLPEYNDIKINTVKALWPDRPLKVVGEGNAAKANEFATDLFRKAYAENPGNTCLSPASVFLTLAMSANGDDGECRDEILSLLGYGEGPEALHELNVYSNALLVEVPDFNGDTRCGFTNSLWHRPDFELMPSFANDLADIYAASDFSVWLGDETGRATINEFVEKNTRGMIKEFLKEPIEIDLGILNTTYFKGAWKQKFEKKHTTTDSFHNADGSVSKTNFMTLSDNMACTRNGSLTAVRLPYAGDRYMMTLIQPCNPDHFNDLIGTLDSRKINDITSSLYLHPVELRLPKYETEINLDILDFLRDLGLDKTCCPGLLNAAAGGPVKLTMFRHAVKLIVNEEGTEGGAASLAGFIYTSASPTESAKPISIKFDHPFLYMIQDNISGTVLFMGAQTSF